MIGFLRGTLREKRPPYLLLDVGGVGYELEAPLSTFYELPEDGTELTLYTHLLVRDDAHTLYGFAPMLTRLPGIGKRTAERLIVEMRDRVPSGTGGARVALAAAGDLAAPPRSPSDDAVDALVALGYRPQEAQRMIAAVQQDGLGSEALIREALRAAVR